MPDPQPSRREHFEVAIICALPLEYNAVIHIFDRFWDTDGDPFGRSVGDDNSYRTGRIGRHDVVLTLLPHMGKVDAATAAVNLRASYTDIRLVLLVGICGGAPRYAGNDIFLGDVIISKTVIQYDFGRQYPDVFKRKDTFGDNLRKPDKNVRGLLAALETEDRLERLEQFSIRTLKVIQDKMARTKKHGKYDYPGASEDNLYEPGYRHKHHNAPSCICRDCFQSSDPVCESALGSSCISLVCNETHLSRKRSQMTPQGDQTSDLATSPAVYIGPIASGDMVIKSAEHRDKISAETGALAIEMEGAGIWDVLPSLVVKGVCDYADCHKHKSWQDYAAATAASTAKAILETYIRTDSKHDTQIGEDSNSTAATGTTQAPETANAMAIFNAPVTAHNMVSGNQFSGGTYSFNFK